MILKKKQSLINKNLPHNECDTDKEPNKIFKPFYCYPYEHLYTGINHPKKSSNAWFKMMANMCNIDIDLNKKNHKKNFLNNLYLI